jgi:DNA-binding GntR family transcriptional regulator
MGVTRLQTPATLREATVEHLRNDIITGQLKPGELLKEMELAAQLGLSPTPIREALVQLAGQGLVEIEPNRLKRVAPLHLPTMCELLAVQRVLWQAGYSWGLPRVGPAELAAMEGALVDEAEALEREDCRAAFLASTALHNIVVTAAGNRELCRLIADRFGLIERLVVLCLPDYASPQMLEQDRAVFSALKRGDLAQALDCGEAIRARFAEALAALLDTPGSVCH